MRFALLLLLTGCATTWDHPTKTQADLDEDWAQCEMRFADLVSRDPMYGAVMREKCLVSKGWRAK